MAGQDRAGPASMLWWGTGATSVGSSHANLRIYSGGRAFVWKAEGPGFESQSRQFSSKLLVVHFWPRLHCISGGRAFVWKAEGPGFESQSRQFSSKLLIVHFLEALHCIVNNTGLGSKPPPAMLTMPIIHIA
ncbi:hypothetical protein M0804_008825 [Polistes exclamans]|nr:hypothetical protein M0804_008825 [Polistes exclamans]